MIFQVAFHEKFTQILPVNYNEDAQHALGYFGYENDQFKYNSSYFDDVSEDAAEYVSQRRRRRDVIDDVRPTEPDWSVLCDNCYMYYLPEVLL